MFLIKLWLVLLVLSLPMLIMSWTGRWPHPT